MYIWRLSKRELWVTIRSLVYNQIAGEIVTLTEYCVAGRGKNNVPNVVFSQGISIPVKAVIHQLMPP
jgi:hypothetical protein